MIKIKLSLCITTFQRFDLTMKSFEKVLNDDRITEVVILDDCSDYEYFDKILEATQHMTKVRILRNEVNIGMAANKVRSVEVAYNDWCLVGDSDNIFASYYIDSFEAFVNDNLLESHCIYMPDFAMPNFDYREFAGIRIDRNNVKEYIGRGTFGAALNTSNFIVNRQEYIDTFTPNKDIRGTDTIWHLYKHLERGGILRIVPGMRYFHLVSNHPSEFMKDLGYNMKKATEIEQLILAL